RNVRDKSRMKTVLRAAGLPCARHQLVTRTEEAERFVEEVGRPLVAKPPDGAGARSTFRLDTDADVRSWLQGPRRGHGEVWLLEQLLTGQERGFDSGTHAGRLLCSSISHDPPPPLDVLRNPWLQWTALLPRAASGPEYDDIRRRGRRALEALGV